MKTHQKALNLISHGMLLIGTYRKHPNCYGDIDAFLDNENTILMVLEDLLKGNPEEPKKKYLTPAGISFIHGRLVQAVQYITEQANAFGINETREATNEQQNTA